jgi:pyruvate dehydrogenase E1 component alpha subunit
VEELKRNDPITSLAAHLRKRNLLDDQKDEAVRGRAHTRVTEAYDFARKSDYPEAAEAVQHVFVS